MHKIRLFLHKKVLFHKLTFQCFPFSTVLKGSSHLRIRKSKCLESTLNTLTRNRFYFNSVRLSSCSFTNCKDKVDDNSKDKDFQKALDDEEFQSILKDFSKDFGVGDETSKILEDIKKNIEDEEYNVSNDKTKSESDKSNAVTKAYNAIAQEKYKDFKESDSSYIFSYEDFQAQDHDSSEMSYHVTHELEPCMTYEQLKRGIYGVFDIHELVDVLRNEKLSDIVVISVPKELHYTDFLVLATAKSPRHSTAATEQINKLYKKKKGKKDPFILIEGKMVPDWKALDMGNIVLHVLLHETRALYDIESLWLLDSSYDSGGNVKADPMIDAIEEQLAFFNSLQKMDSPLEKETS